MSNVKIRDKVLALEKEDKKCIRDISRRWRETSCQLFRKKRAKKKMLTTVTKELKDCASHSKVGKSQKTRLISVATINSLEISKGSGKSLLIKRKLTRMQKWGWPERLHNQHRLKR